MIRFWKWSLFFFHLTHVHITHVHLHLLLLFLGVFASFINYILDILISIGVILLLHILHLLCLKHLLLFQQLLLLNGMSIFFLRHIVLLLISLWSILDQMGVVTCLHFNVTFGVWHPIFWRRNVSTFVMVIKFDSL